VCRGPTWTLRLARCTCASASATAFCCCARAVSACSSSPLVALCSLFISAYKMQVFEQADGPDDRTMMNEYARRQCSTMLESDKAQICWACCSSRAASYQPPRPIKIGVHAPKSFRTIKLMTLCKIQAKST